MSSLSEMYLGSPVLSLHLQKWLNPDLEFGGYTVDVKLRLLVYALMLFNFLVLPNSATVFLRVVGVIFLFSLFFE